MLMPVSPEFVELCQSQVALLAQGLRASWIVVYLTTEKVHKDSEVELEEDSEAKLIPIVAYPETAGSWEDNNTFTLNPSDTASQLRRLPSGNLAPGKPVELGDWQSAAFDFNSTGYYSEEKTQTGLSKRQIVLPLIHEGTVMGLLVTNREDRPWNKRERLQIERIAHTIALACFLDRRQAYWKIAYRQQQYSISQQYDILDNLLHQIRSPLTALKTFGKLLLKRLKPTDSNRDIAQHILRESDRLQELLTQMDAVTDQPHDAASQLLPPEEDGPVASPLPLLPPSGVVSCFVAEVLEPLVVSATAIAGERQLQVHSHIPTNLPPVKANPQALREVLSNLTDNALKYTSIPGHIFIEVSEIFEPPARNDTTKPQVSTGVRLSEAEVSTTTQPDNSQASSLHAPSQSLSHWVTISITDTGKGIPPQDLEHIFERHYRGIQAETDIPGTGLGLAIAKQLIEQMQGKIEVFSPALRELPTSEPGTSFVVWLPVVNS
ncbi:GAF domain-containing sensor histidine kinase [Ancylothrix sp. C2]|uniref:GAF domain-containing sensor histidine kinase n=1 Tax=Ancylothrix sp. D3o TaxID=2953691 RepID=UPI0021BB7A09|nr:GAF domain-containing sensor histidine kinase [Ancylothrix sp. D3o]MCT7949143.1 GAF domain-containing sensor histidine kinase [Ancylothrix sp. D3o]